MQKAFVLICCSFLASCTYDQEDVNPVASCSGISFSKDISPIIAGRCAISGCHVSWFPPGNFTVFDSLKIKIDNGTFMLRVIDLKSMPPRSALSETDLNKIQCWLENGALNN